MTKQEADENGFLDKFVYLANECLTMIAGDLKPNVKKMLIENMGM